MSSCGLPSLQALFVKLATGLPYVKKCMESDEDRRDKGGVIAGYEFQIRTNN